MHLLCLQSSQDILISFGVRIVFPFSLMEMGGASGQKKNVELEKKMRTSPVMSINCYLDKPYLFMLSHNHFLSGGYLE